MYLMTEGEQQKKKERKRKRNNVIANHIVYLMMKKEKAMTPRGMLTNFQPEFNIKVNISFSLKNGVLGFIS